MKAAEENTDSLFLEGPIRLLKQSHKAERLVKWVTDLEQLGLMSEEDSRTEEMTSQLVLRTGGSIWRVP